MKNDSLSGNNLNSDSTNSIKQPSDQSESKPIIYWRTGLALCIALLIPTVGISQPKDSDKSNELMSATTTSECLW